MHCKKCDGRVFVDRTFSDDSRIELFCLPCGNRWMLKNTHPLGSLLLKIESAWSKATAVV